MRKTESYTLKLGGIEISEAATAFKKYRDILVYRHNFLSKGAIFNTSFGCVFPRQFIVILHFHSCFHKYRFGNAKNVGFLFLKVPYINTVVRKVRIICYSLNNVRKVRIYYFYMLNSCVHAILSAQHCVLFFVSKIFPRIK